MTHNERIERMLSSGTITERQAEMLRDSLSRGAGSVQAGPPRRRGHRWAVALGLVVFLAAAAWLILAGQGPDGVQDVSETLNQPGEIGAMNKNLSTVLAILILAILPLVLFVWLYNDLVSKEEKVFEAWAQTESNFQRRADLVPALVDTVSRYLKHERETLGEVTEARGRPVEALAEELDALIRAQKEAADLLREQTGRPPEQEALMDELASAERQMGLRLRAILATAEDYPELRSSDQFLQLQAQIEGTENRINVARMRFNEAVRSFNGAIRKLPGSLIAGLGNFQRKAYFQAEEGGGDAPDLDYE
ncbi:MAG: LemA family protein [Rhodovibrionaceae bacterium]|nr:LemA family protein [Rhodovibrionaceae bacterium]